MSTQFTRLKKTDLTPEEQALFDELSDRMELNISDPEELRNAYQNLNVMKGVIQDIDTKRGRQYALSRLLNDPKYGFDSDLYKRENPYLDAWNLKYQEDFKPIDVLREEAKLDNEQFYDKESPKHWSKRSPSELKERAIQYGYTDIPAYLKQLEKDQNAIDREKLYEEEAHKGFWNGGWGIPLPATLMQAAYPRASDAVLRGDDIQGEDLALDGLEQAFYGVNPAGRGAQALARGKNIGKFGKYAIDAIDAVANPAIMETADALLYNDPNNDRSEFSKADVGMGAGINFGMNRIVGSLFKDMDRLGNTKYINSKSYEKDRAALDKLNKLAETANSTDNVILSDILNRKTLDKLTEMVEKGKLPQGVVDRLTNKWNQEVTKRDLANDAISLISNKFGDELFEHPDLAKKVIRRAIRVPGVNLAAPLVDAYYDAKKPETEKEKLERLYGAQF